MIREARENLLDWLIRLENWIHRARLLRKPDDIRRAELLLFGNVFDLARASSR
jgi:hypothetical protein